MPGMSDGTGAATSGRWRRVPAVRWLPRYERGWLRGDVVAGAVVAALAIPQALGYASIAGAPVEVGLYAVPVALIAYAVFGSSRQLVVGPVSTVSVLSGSLLAGFGVAGTARAASYTAALALGSGLVLVTAGFLGVGWVAEFLSKPIVTGFVLGLTVLVILNEVPHLLGVPTPKGQVVERVGSLGESLTRGEADLATVIVSAVSLLVLFGGQRLAPRVPWGLVVLLGGIAASSALDLRARGVEVVGPVPRGLPTPGLPSVAAGDLPALLGAGAALALVGLAEGLSAARLFAARGGYRVDADQELLASGAANLGSGCVRRHRRGRQPLQDGSRQRRSRAHVRWPASPRRCWPWSSSSPSRRCCRGCRGPSSAPSWSTRSGSSWTSRHCAATPGCAATTSSPRGSPPSGCWPSGRCTACCWPSPGRCWAWSTGPAGSTSR